LEARNAGSLQGRQVIRQRKIFHGKWKALTGIAFNGGAVTQLQGGTADVESIAARVGALAPIAAAAKRLRREKAQAAVGITQRPMNEDLGFNARGLGDVVDLLEGQFPRQHHAAKTKIAERLGPRSVVNCKLRAGM